MAGIDRDRAAERRRDLSASAVGYQLVLSVLAGAGLGWALDRRAGSSPYGLLAGLGLGVAAAIGAVIQLYLAEQRRQQETERSSREPHEHR